MMMMMTGGDGGGGGTDLAFEHRDAAALRARTAKAGRHTGRVAGPFAPPLSVSPIRRPNPPYPRPRRPNPAN